jgi:Ni/Fe-hydrogenase subunit HybB-like protein
MWLLFHAAVNTSPDALYLCSVLTLLGFITNRLNVAITGMEASSGTSYFPKWTELAITTSLVASAFAVFRLAVKYLPVFPPVREPAWLPAPAAAASSAPDLSHAARNQSSLVAGQRALGMATKVGN